MDGFTYTQSHVLNSSAALTDYQIKFTVYKGNGTSNNNIIYCKTHCKDDFNDLRFSIDETTALPYWIESYVSGTSAIIWVNLLTLASTQTMYVHYGNASATPVSNGATTFPVFFDDFSGTLNTTRWTTPASYTMSSGTIALGVTSCGANALCSQNSYDLSTNILVGKQKVSDITPGQYLMCGFNTAKQSHANGTYQAAFTFWAATSYFMTRNVGTGTSCSAMSGTSTGSDLYYTTELHKIGNTVYITTVDGYGGSSIQSCSTNTDSTNSNYIEFEGFTEWGSNSINTIDYVFLRKYTTTEPTHSTWGAEVTSAPTALSKSYVINMW